MAGLGQRLLDEAEAAQAAASDPRMSAWVSANAGTGKTHVLKRRVLRLLMGGTPPGRILCLTFTKAAAAEMASRVFADLASWATAASDDLETKLTGVLCRAPTNGERALARQLFARVIEAPGGLKVQTIHAFCERLLQRFPLEAGVPAGFTVLEEDAAAGLTREAIDQVLSAASADPRSPLGIALHRAVAFAQEDRFDEVLREALARRDWIEWVNRLELRGRSDPFDSAEQLYRQHFGVRDGVGITDFDAKLINVLSERDLPRAAAVLLESTANDRELGRAFKSASEARNRAIRLAALEEAFLTEKKKPRSDRRFVTKAVQTAQPRLYSSLVTARDAFAGLYCERQALITAESTAALLRLANAVLQRSAEAKAKRAALDFDDLIRHTANMLRHARTAQWVLYKLDGGIDHILVDEAQDTSPEQWSVIEALAQEFFAGATAREVGRTLFAVGDEKQSIYGFQGAEPKMFAATGRRFAQAARVAERGWHDASLTHSFRSVAPVLDAVDRVFAQGRTPGLDSTNKKIRHAAMRIGQAGLVEIWPRETHAALQAVDAWSPLDEAPVAAPVRRLADRIAKLIGTWIKNKERLASQDRSIRPGDILILVRKRKPFASAMVAALEAVRVPVAGADRLDLTEQTAVQDLLALADFLVLSEDDLALACVLKSPLFGLDDEDLLTIALERRGTLWAALRGAAAQSDRLRYCVETLSRLQSSAMSAAPFEFFATLLDAEGGRARLLAGLGPEAADAIAEFMQLALAYDSDSPSSLVGFVDWLRRGARDVRRDMDQGRDEVRVMTVHGAKGLEAPIVFLPDTCGAAKPRNVLLELPDVGLPAGSPEPFVWPIKGANVVASIERARSAAASVEAEESHRLLYVAMTRARDRLYIAGFEGKNGAARDCWHDIVTTGLDGALSPITQPDGTIVQRLSTKQVAPSEEPRLPSEQSVASRDLPDWAARVAPPERRLVIPLVPSRIAIEAEEASSHPRPRRPSTPPWEPAAPSPLARAEDRRFVRGLLTHALLQYLPAINPGNWKRAARSFVDTRAPELPRHVRKSIAAETLAVLRKPEFAAVFGPGSRAEVPIVAEIPAPDGGAPLRINGQLDRLVHLDHEVLIVDYKTNRPPPSNVTTVPRAYLYQLAGYRLAVGRIFAGLPVRAAILWTDGPSILPIPADMLDAHEKGLWQLDPDRLDAPRGAT